MHELESLCNDGEVLAGLILRFRERVGKGMRFGDTLRLLEAADHALAKRMNLTADVIEAVVRAEDSGDTR